MYVCSMDQFTSLHLDQKPLWWCQIQLSPIISSGTMHLDMTRCVSSCTFCIPSPNNLILRKKSNTYMWWLKFFVGHSEKISAIIYDLIHVH